MGNWKIQSKWSLSSEQNAGKKKKCLDYIPESSDSDLIAIQQAVQNVIMPEMSPETQNMVVATKKPRKRVQLKYGEVLTSSESLKRLNKDGQND